MGLCVYFFESSGMLDSSEEPLEEEKSVLSSDTRHRRLVTFCGFMSLLHLSATWRSSPDVSESVKTFELLGLFSGCRNALLISGEPWIRGNLLMCLKDLLFLEGKGEK